MKKSVSILCLLMTSLFCFAQKIEIANITASSTLESPTNLYEVNHLIDGTDKSWVEGEDGSGIGTVITINFKNSVEIQTFYIKNGYGDFKHYYENNRVRNLSCSFQKRGGVSINLEDRPGFQKVEFDTPIVTNKLVLTINDVYKGNKYDDTAITEISFDNWENLNHQELNSSIIAYRLDDIYDCYKKKDSTITEREYKSRFTSARLDSRHGEDWFSYSCHNDIIPLKNGGMYFLSYLSSECMGQKRTSSYDDIYILFSKLDGEKIMPCQNEFISLGTESDIKEIELELQKKDLKDKEKKFMEKYIKIVKDLESSRKSNLPFLSTLFSSRVSNNGEVELYINDYVDFSWYKIESLFPGYRYKVKYCAPTEIISEVSLP